MFYCSYFNGDIIFAGEKTINRVEFSTCLNELKNETHNGFTEQEVEILIDALVSIKNLGKLFSYCTFSETCFGGKKIKSLVIFQPIFD